MIPCKSIHFYFGQGGYIMNKKCKYCNKPITLQENIDYCSNKCKIKFESFMVYYQKTKWFFYLLLTISVGVILLDSIIATLRNFSFIGFGLLGLTLLFFPFGTSLGNEIHGLKSEIIIVRILAIVLILLGTFILIQSL